MSKGKRCAEKSDDGEVVFKAGIKKFKVDPYYVIIDRLSSSLSKQIYASPLSALPAQRIEYLQNTAKSCVRLQTIL